MSRKDIFIERAKEKFGDKFDYSLVDYTTTKNEVTIICPIHGEFRQAPRNHLRSKTGCVRCLTLKKQVKGEVIKPKVKVVKPKVKVVKPKVKVVKPKIDYSNSGTSKSEKEIVDFIKSIYSGEIIENDRSILNGKEIDIYLPEVNIGIEFDGLYWHNQGNLEKRGVNPKKYHLEKTIACVEKGIRLIHIFEDEWYDKRVHVESRLKHFLGVYTNRIGARQTEIRNLPASDRRTFLDRNHIQGKDGAAFSYGAYYKNKLVGVMSFCRPRISMGMKGSAIQGGMYELSRFAVESGYQIYGLASKMFKHFIKVENVDMIYTYSDLRWNKYHGTGTVYEKIGMKYISSSSPSYFYIKDMKREYRFGYRKNILVNKLETFDPDMTEYENCLANGLDRIFDCGCDKFIWEKETGLNV